MIALFAPDTAALTPSPETPRPAPGRPPLERDTRPHATHLLRHGAQVVTANFIVAALLATMAGGQHFGRTLLYAETIGVLIWLGVEFGRLVLPMDKLDGWPVGWRKIALLAAACGFGYVAGTTIVDTILGVSTWQASVQRPRSLFSDLVLTATFAAVISGWFYQRSRSAAHAAQVAAAAHEATLARLVLLQSQLEPHMLFNTLANLRALISADPERAQAMLDRLIDFLRATLAASRVAAHPLRDEFARVDDYLALMKVRMGDRLATSSLLPPELADVPVPPLLLQPLVENAIKHGLEPQRGPGELAVAAVRDGAMLVLTVVDTGRGFDAAAAANAREPSIGSGFGLVQIRERLQTLHGDAASFTLAPRAEGGTRAEIRLPLPATLVQHPTPT